MASNTDIMIQVEADVAKAIQNIQELEKSLKTTQTTINNQLAPSSDTLGGKISGLGNRMTQFGNTIREKIGLEGALAFAAVGKAATSMAKQCVDAAMKSESEWTRFGALVNSNGGNWQAEEGRIKSWASKHANAMGYAVSDTRAASMALLQYGVTSKQLETAMNGVAGVAARTGMTEVEASNMVISALNGRGMQLAKMTGLRIEDYKNADGQIDRERLLNDLYNQNKDAIEAHSKTTEAAIQRMNNNWGSFKKQVGDALLPVVNILADFVGNLAKWFKDLPEPVKQFIAVLLLLGGAIGTALGALAFLAPIFTTLGPIITMVGGAISAVGGFLGPLITGMIGTAVAGGGLTGVIGVITASFGALLAPISGLIVPILAVIAAFAALYLVGASLGWWNDLGGMINKIGEALGWLLGALAPVGDAFMALGGAIMGLLGWLGLLFTDFGAARAQLMDFLGGLGGSIMDALGSVGAMLGDIFQGIMTGLMDALRGAGNGFADAFNGLVDAGVQAAGDLITGFMNGIGELGSVGAAMLGDIFQGIMTGLMDAIRGAGNGLADAFNGLVDAGVQAVGDLGTNIVSYLSQLPGIIAGALSNLGASVVPGGGLVEGILAIVAPLPMLLYGKFMELAPAVLPAVQAFIMQVVNAFVSIGTSILQTFMNIPILIGQFFMQLPVIIQTFLMSAVMSVTMYVGMIWMAIVTRFNMLVMQVRMVWMFIVMAIRTRLMQAWMLAGNLAMMIRNAIVTRFNLIIARVRSIFQNIVNTIRSRLSSAVSQARSKAQSIYQGIKDKVSKIPEMVATEFGKIKDRIVSKLNDAKNAAVQKISDLVAAVKGALGIASPGFIQRMFMYEFTSIPGIINDNSRPAIKAAGQMASDIVTSWTDGLGDGLVMPMDNLLRQSVDGLVNPDLFNPLNNILNGNIGMERPEDTVTSNMALFGRDMRTNTTPQTVTTSNQNNTTNNDDHSIVYHIDKISLECGDLTQAQSRRILYDALDGLYTGGA